MAANDSTVSLKTATALGQAPSLCREELDFLYGAILSHAPVPAAREVSARVLGVSVTDPGGLEYRTSAKGLSELEVAAVIEKLAAAAGWPWR